MIQYIPERSYNLTYAMALYVSGGCSVMNTNRYQDAVVYAQCVHILPNTHNIAIYIITIYLLNITPDI